jgi:hypothetical protein
MSKSDKYAIKVDPNNPALFDTVEKLLVELGLVPRPFINRHTLSPKAGWIYYRKEHSLTWAEPSCGTQGGVLINLTDEPVGHIVQFDGGEPVEISEESFNALKKALSSS